jgi:glycosyltransferase involved in cell wall biosynthesis
MPLSIIVPCRNEAGNIASCLERVLSAVPGAEILVVDGGTDATGRIVGDFSRRWPSVRYLANPDDRGKGHAVRVGIRESRQPVIVQLDADLQFRPEEIPRLVEPILRGEADVALGSRFSAGSSRHKGSSPPVRHLGNLFFSGYVSFLCRHQMRDVLAGFKAWRREVTDSFRMASDTFSYETEIPVKALRRGWRVVDVPVTYHSRASGSSSVQVVRTGLTILLDSLRFRLEPLRAR